MGWSIGYDDNWKRDVGYGVPAHCDHPECSAEIDRGLSHVCGGQPYGGGSGCGLYFCSEHLFVYTGPKHVPQLCARCVDGDESFDPTPDHPDWMRWKLTDESWQQWRDENPDEVERLKAALQDEGRTVEAVKDAAGKTVSSHENS